MYAAGLTVFALASAACGLAPSGGLLIGARFAQGLGAALIVPTSLALIRHAYDDVRERAHAVAVWVAAGGAALAAGPVAGGVLIDALGWRSIFLINIVVGLLAVWVTITRVASVPTERRRLDAGGQLLGIVAIGGLTFALIEGPVLGWGAPAILAAIAAAVLGGVAFVGWERRASDPMLPPALAQRPRFIGVALCGATLNLTFYGLLFVLSLYFQQVRGDTPVQTGLAFLPMTGLIWAVNLAAPRIAARVGTLATIVTGQLLFAAGLVATLTLGRRSPELATILALLPIGLGGLSVPPLAAASLETAPAALAGVASGAFNASRQVGGAVGVALFGALLGAHAGADFMTGMRLALLAALAATGVAVALSTAFLRRPAEAPA